MAILKRLNTTPPGGWQYIQPETKLKLIGDSFDALERNVKAHREHRGIPIPEGAGLSREIQRQICERLTDHDCFPEGEKDPWVPRPNTPLFTLRDILAFSKTALDFIQGGGVLEDIQEVNRRREVCENCPLNSVATGCKCSIFYKAVDAVIPRERRFASLHICGACSCSLVAKVNLPAETIAAGERGADHRFPINCWVPGVLEQTKKD